MYRVHELRAVVMKQGLKLQIVEIKIFVQELSPMDILLHRIWVVKQMY